VTSFCPWYPLAEAARRAPAARGIYQVKLPYLVDYPTGRSAMIQYGAAEDLRTALVALERAHGRSTLLARHEGAAEDQDVERQLEILLERFRRRFGAEPSLPGAP
jgi:hypothetical protein